VDLGHLGSIGVGWGSFIANFGNTGDLGNPLANGQELTANN
jgi:hypothetical protein